MKCIQCGKDLKTDNKAAKFCSGACRVKASRSKGKEQVKEERKVKVVKKITSSTKDIPEEELNYFYRGPEGKLRLAYDEVHALYFNSGPVIYLEKERVRILQEKMKGIK